MNIGNITSDNFNLDGNGKDIQIEVYEQLIEQLKKENQELKLELSGYRQAILEDKKMLGLKQENQKYKEAIDKTIEFTNKNWGTWCSHHIEYMTELQNILKEGK